MKSLTALNLMSCVVAVIFMVAASIAYAGQEGVGKGAEPSATVEVDLSELNDSGVSGTATLMPVGNNQTKVTIELTGAPEGGTHPVHIHTGTCESLGGVEYPLGDIKNGKSVTVIDTSLNALTAESYAINVHKSSDEASVYVACGTTGEKGEEMASGAVEVELSEVSDSGVTGMATLTPMDDQTKVVINLTGAPEGGVHPVHIHKGTCDSLGEATYPLNDIRNGTSETVINADLKSLTAESYAINVHKSSNEASTYVACGTVGGSGEAGSQAVDVELNAQNNSGVSGTATLMPVGDNQTKVTIELTGAPEGGIHPVHIHRGTCKSLKPEPAYPLNDIQNGKSETVVEASLESLTTGSYAINVHKSSSEASTYVACGTIQKNDHTHMH